VLSVGHDDLKVLVLLCKNSMDSANVRNAGFIICGNYLCYQYPNFPVVNIMELGQLLREEKA
jgi:hypothetical protein